jgi:hypothetical protein
MLASSNDLDLSKCFDFGQVKKCKENLDKLCNVLESSDSLENGWLMAHFDDSLSANALFVYFAALLATRWTLDADLLFALKKAVVGDRELLLSKELVASVLVATKTSERKQRISDGAIVELVGAFEHPRGHFAMLEARNRTDENSAGWIRSEWFSGSSNKAKLTSLEVKVLQVQVLLAIDTIVFDQTDPQCMEKARKDRQAARDKISKAWGSSDQKIGRHMKELSKKIKNPTVAMQSNRQEPRRRTRLVDEDALYGEAHGSPSPPQSTPMLTRVTHFLKEASRSYMTPRTPRLVSSPGSRRLPLLFAVFQKKITLATSRQQLYSSDSEAEESTSQLSIEGTNLFGSEQESTNHLEEELTNRLCEEGTNLFTKDEADCEVYSEGEQDAIHPSTPEVSPPYRFQHPSTPEVSPPYRARDLPKRRAVSKQNEDTSFDLDAYLAEEEEAHEMEVAETIEAHEMEVAEGIRVAKTNDSVQLLRTVAHLAAVGSASIQKVMKALLLQSMTKRHASHYLLENGYSKKRQQQVIEHKRAANQGRIRKAASRNEEPVLVPETATLKYAAPLQNNISAARAKRNYKDYLAKGDDIPPALRPTSVSEEKIDFLMEWIVKNCQFRPGKTRNVYFKKDKMVLKNLPLYMRYGSIESLYKSFCNVVPNILKVGEKTFRKILSATTLKGTYNQGLSYFYVDFVDLTKLVLKMLGRLESMTADNTVVTEKRNEINKWLKHAREHTEFASLYLRHGYYGDIRKSSTDGFTCAAHALGHKCNHEHAFDKNHKLALVLTNHFLIAHVIELVTSALPESDFDALSDEFHSMFELARLSGLEMLHYVKHLIRGWWQDTAIKELKRMMLLYPWLKGCVTDHKNKLLPRCKDEAMSMFFSKAGISVLGAMVFWAGTKEVKGKEVKGLFIWFIDMVMENTTSQEARDLMPCIEVLRGELQQDYFVDIAGPTKGLFLLSDNALVDASLSAFIHALNQQCLSKSASGQTRATLVSRSSSSEESGDEMCESPIKGISLPEDRMDGTDEIQNDEFVKKMRSLYQSKIGNWDSHVEPYVSQWLTWEAQRCKTELDTHFAYINKQLAKACLEGGIDYLDAAKVFEALAYGGVHERQLRFWFKSLLLHKPCLMLARRL